MVKCENCGQDNPENSAFCLKCQYKLKKQVTVNQSNLDNGSRNKKLLIISIVAIIIVAIACFGAYYIFTNDSSAQSSAHDTNANGNSVGSSQTGNTQTYEVEGFVVQYPDGGLYQAYSYKNKVSFFNPNGDGIGYIEYITGSFESAEEIANAIHSDNGDTVVSYEDATLYGYPGVIVHTTYEGHHFTYRCFEKGTNLIYICTDDNKENSNLLYDTFQLKN